MHIAKEEKKNKLKIRHAQCAELNIKYGKHIFAVKNAINATKYRDKNTLIARFAERNYKSLERDCMIIDITQQNKIAMKWILNLQEFRQAYIEKSANFSTLGATQYDGMPHAQTVGNPCMNKTLTLLDMEEQRKWIMVIEKMEQTLSEKSRKYLELRRDAVNQFSNNVGRPGWVEYVQPKYVEWFKYRYGREIEPPTRGTMTEWMRKILDVTIRIAFNDGVLKI
jgi:hypothetical protein